MTEIHHRQLSSLINDSAGPPGVIVWLIHGEEVLVEQCCEQLVAHLLGDAVRDLSHERVEGLVENIPDLLEALNTFALLGSGKVFVFSDAKLFDDKDADLRLMSRIEQTWTKGRHEKAAQLFAGLCNRLNLATSSPAEIEQNAGMASLAAAIGQDAMRRLSHTFSENNAHNVAKIDISGALLSAVEKGFPKGNSLIITVLSKVPKNLKLYKTIKTCGVVVDCTVPKGERRADKDAQTDIMRQALEERLSQAGKTIQSGLFDTLVQLTGFDLRRFIQNIEKLIDYCGHREEITANDIRSVLRRTKQDPLYALTNAIADRDTVKALFYAGTLLENEFHPLQLLSALANQIRKLLIAKAFCESDFGRAWRIGMPYQQFQQQVLPAVIAYDEHYQKQATEWRGAGSGQLKKEAADLRLAPNAKNPYPVYQTLIKAGNFMRHELTAAMLIVGRSDLRMKSTGQNPVLIIKKTILDICWVGGEKKNVKLGFGRDQGPGDI